MPIFQGGGKPNVKVFSCLSNLEIEENSSLTFVFPSQKGGGSGRRDASWTPHFHDKMMIFSLFQLRVRGVTKGCVHASERFSSKGEQIKSITVMGRGGDPPLTPPAGTGPRTAPSLGPHPALVEFFYTKIDVFFRGKCI